MKDRNLTEKLKAEASGILNWALDGLRQWRLGGLQEPEQVVQATQEYRESMDVIGHFIEERCTVGKSRTIGKTILYDAYNSGRQILENS